MKNSIKIKEVISELPEIYQPIFNYPEFSDNTSRVCEDRLAYIQNIYNLLEIKLQRPLKVLDLGCAQGYFAFSLASSGAIVTGVDFLDKNIAVCKALSDENPLFQVNFQVDRIENIIKNLNDNEFDLVLGLSVFHHIVYEHGLELTKQYLLNLAKKVKVGIFEIALNNEPLYWSTSQAKNPRELLEGFSYVSEMAEFETHLSKIKRPLYFVSNDFIIINNSIFSFLEKKINSHKLNNNVHANSRNYYFSEDYIIKQYLLESIQPHIKKINIKEYYQEIEFLTNLKVVDNLHSYPKIIEHEANNKELILVREKIKGDLLLDIIHSGNNTYNVEELINKILELLIKLEKIGYYHNDLRVWNLLIDDNSEVHLIDYGAINCIAEDCSWPVNNYISFFLLLQELITNEIILPEERNFFQFQFDKLPIKYLKAFKDFFLHEKSELSFKLLYNILNGDFINENKQSIFPIIFNELNILSNIYKTEKIYLEDMIHEVTNRSDENEKKHQAEKEYLENMVHEVTNRSDENEKKHQAEKEYLENMVHEVTNRSDENEKKHQAEKEYLENMVHEVTNRSDKNEKKHQAEKEYLENILHEVTNRANKYEKEYLNIVQSKFWKFTFWIRFIINKIKG